MKILSLDGGGSWALIQACCLKDLYGNIDGHTLLREFNMVIANSGGSMVLAALAEGLLLEDVIALFRNENSRKDIFSKLHFWEKSIVEDAASILVSIGPKYSTERKLIGLRKHLPKMGGKYLSEIPALIDCPELQIIICSFDYERNREVFFRSNKKSRADSAFYAPNPACKFIDVTLAEAVHGASNAPVNYFNKPALINFKGENFKRNFWDGAVGGYNNPVFAGVLEALVNGTPVANMKVLTIGTASVLLPLLCDQSTPPEKNQFLYVNDKPGFGNDIEKMATSVLDDPPDSASFHAYSVIDPALPPLSKQFFRFSPLIKPVYKNGRWDIPANFSADEFSKLISLGMDAVEQDEVNLIYKLCMEWLKPGSEIDNQAIRINCLLQPIIGYGKYDDGKNGFRDDF